MSSNRKASSRPVSWPLDLVLAALKASGLSAKQNGDSVIVGHNNFTTRIDGVAPTNRGRRAGGSGPSPPRSLY
jgi:hypothetical protein